MGTVLVKRVGELHAAETRTASEMPRPLPRPTFHRARDYYLRRGLSDFEEAYMAGREDEFFQHFFVEWCQRFPVGRGAPKEARLHLRAQDKTVSIQHFLRAQILTGGDCNRR